MRMFLGAQSSRKGLCTSSRLAPTSVCRRGPGFDSLQHGDHLIRLLSLTPTAESLTYSVATLRRFSFHSSRTIARVHLKPRRQSQIHPWLLFRIGPSCSGWTCGDEVMASLGQIAKAIWTLGSQDFYGADRQALKAGWLSEVHMAGHIQNIQK